MTASPARGTNPAHDPGWDAERALLASGHAFSVTDQRQPDCPLVWVNPAFERLTGYTWDDAVGRNCRFLQGPDTDPASARRMRAALDAGRPITETLLNYRQDGSTWWNYVVITPVRDADGELTHFVGVQSDVSDRVAADRQRDDARSDADTAQARLALLAEAGAALGAAIEPADAAWRLTELLVPDFAAWCSIALLDRAGPSTPPLLTLAHRDPELGDAVAWLREHWRPDIDEDAVPTRVIATGRPVMRNGVEDAPVDGEPEWATAWRRLGTSSYLSVPLTARGVPVGSVTLGRCGGDPGFTPADLTFATELGRRTGVALETASLYASEHSTALTLQRSLLPELPEIEHLELAARYLPGSELVEVGGDWYDVLPLPDGSTGVAVGDVMGHDIRAAAAMGQFRSVLRSYAWEGHGPAGVLDRLNQLVCGLGMAQFATCFYARIEPAGPDRPAILRWANAGHPPPLLRTPDGTVHLLDDGASPLIGIKRGETARLERASADRPLPPGSTLLIYTDGLIEDRHRDLDEGTATLRDSLAGAAPGLPLDALADRLIEAAGAGGNDDRCLLLVRIAD